MMKRADAAHNRSHQLARRIWMDLRCSVEMVKAQYRISQMWRVIRNRWEGPKP